MTPAQTALLEKARDSLRAARLLALGDLHDFAVARAYYTMFYLASALLLEQGRTFSKHGSTISAFGQHWVKTGRLDAKYHRALREAYEARIVGDYNATAHLTEADAITHVQAEEFMTMAEGVLASLP